MRYKDQLGVFWGGINGRVRKLFSFFNYLALYSTPLGPTNIHLKINCLMQDGFVSVLIKSVHISPLPGRKSGPLLKRAGERTLFRIADQIGNNG